MQQATCLSRTSKSSCVVQSKLGVADEDTDVIGDFMADDIEVVKALSPPPQPSILSRVLPQEESDSGEDADDGALIVNIDGDAPPALKESAQR